MAETQDRGAQAVVRNISDTARWAAVFRARETERADALFRDPYGRAVRKVRVGGDDVAGTLVDAGVAREYDGKNPTWCG